MKDRDFSPAKVKDVCILFSKSVPSICKGVLRDPEGRYIFVMGQIMCQDFVLACVYLQYSAAFILGRDPPFVGGLPGGGPDIRGRFSFELRP